MSSMKKYLLGFFIGLTIALSLAASAAIWKIPSGIVPDNLGYGGLYGLAQNVNNYTMSISAVTTAGTNTTLTAAQALAGVTKLNAGASGAFTITLPSTAALIAALGNTVPTDGTYSEVIGMENNATTFTGTVTAGDVSTTLTGTMTVATNTRREFVLTLTAPTTITIENIGSMGL